MITQDLLTDYLEYKNGGLHWKINTDYARKGSRFGSYDGRYRVGSFFGKRCYEHSLIYLYHYGVWPEQLDHKYCHEYNNGKENLRETTTFLNAQNVEYSQQASNHTGVGYHKRSGKWRARSWKNGKRIEIGRFKTKRQAIEAYRKFNSDRM